MNVARPQWDPIEGAMDEPQIRLEGVKKILHTDDMETHALGGISGILSSPSCRPIYPLVALGYEEPHLTSGNLVAEPVNVAEHVGRHTARSNRICSLSGRRAVRIEPKTALEYE
jgi:hypothetical protein